ncbi:MAG TPA: FtsQ-type POTRA domain-containing protein [Pyrinomonadaceae bacterium]
MLKEQVITPRGGRATGGRSEKGRASGVVQQRPAQRNTRGGSGSVAGGATWRSLVRYVPFLLKFALAVAIGLALFYAYRSAASASFFRLSAIEIEGTSRASREEIKAIVRRQVGGRGVWQADLAAIGAEVKNQPWVRAAVVSRVLPSGVRVRVTEREPRMVVRTTAGRFVWMDEEGVLLGAAQPSDKMPPFFIRGLDEAPTDAARTDNRERIRRALEMAREWEAAGVANRVSEVNLDDLRDVRAQLSGNDSQIEVRLGKEDFGKRLGRALKVLDDLRDSPRGEVVRLDATQEKRVIVGFGTGAKSSDEPNAAAAPKSSSEAQGQSGGGASTSAPARNEASDAKRRDEAGQRVARATRRAAERQEAQREARRESRAEKQTPNRTQTDKTSARPVAPPGERPRRVG